LKVSNEVTVGALTIISIVIFVLGYQFLRGQEVFSRKQLITVVFPDATGVYEANMVTFNGVPIGRISKISYRNDNPEMPVIMKLALEKELAIPKDSRFEIQTLDLLGKHAIAFVPGSSKEMVGKDDVLKGSIKADMIAEVTKELKPITDKATALLTSIDTLVKDVHKALGPAEQNSISATIRSAESAMSNLNTITVKVNKILTSQEGNLEGTLANIKKLTDNLAGNTDKLDNIISNIDKFSNEVGQLELASTIESAKNTLTQINNLLESLNEGQGTLGKMVTDDSLYKSIDEAIGSLNSLLTDLQKNPKRYVSFSLIERKDKTPKEPAPVP
jgi:phospholipid/cholesterol/gamma-HCH transport system substrate-binding protein